MYCFTQKESPTPLFATILPRMWLKRWLRDRFWDPPYPFRMPWLLAKRHLMPDPYANWLKVSTQFGNRRIGKISCERLPRISLLTLVYYPRLSHLMRCIDSVQRQSLRDFEWLVLDNGSDTHLESAWKILENMSQVKVFRDQSAKGIAAGTDFLARQASGNWLAFLDHDDVLSSEALEEVQSVAAEYPNLHLIYSDSDHCDEAGRRFSPFFKPEPSSEYILGTNYICHFHAVRKEFFEENWSALDELDGAQDWDIVIQALEQPNKCHHISKILYSHRVHPNQMSASFLREDGSSNQMKIERSQSLVLQRYLRRHRLDRRYEVCSKGKGLFYLNAKDIPLPNISIYLKDPSQTKKFIEMTDYPVTQLRFFYESFLQVLGADSEYFVWSPNRVNFESTRWLIESVGLLERSKDKGFIGGKVVGPMGEDLTHVSKYREEKFGHPANRGIQFPLHQESDVRREVSAMRLYWGVGRKSAISWDPNEQARILCRMNIVFDPMLIGKLSEPRVWDVVELSSKYS